MKRRQLLVFGAIFAAVMAALAAIYFAFMQPGYSVLYEDIREADAAAIVGELEKQGIAYRLGDQGRSVLVPEDEANQARVVIAGSGIAMGGVVGFELFNESDMGLTEFAQKVNYQRALQGELARTIMMMDGISFARVHLSLPERALFRAVQQSAKAAVTVQTIRKHSLDANQVAGIQRLVASAVAGLSSFDVAIIDDHGDLISPVAASAAESRDLDEQDALEQYYAARARTAAENVLSGVPFEIRVTAVKRDRGESGEAAPSGDGQSDTDPQLRNFRLRIAFRSEAVLDQEDRDLARQAIVKAVQLAPTDGDILRFETGPLGLVGERGSSALPAAPMPPPYGGATLPPAMIPSGPALLAWQSILWLLPALAALGALVFLTRRQSVRLSNADRQSFADLLSDALVTREVDRDEG